MASCTKSKLGGMYNLIMATVEIVFGLWHDTSVLWKDVEKL